MKVLSDHLVEGGPHPSDYNRLTRVFGVVMTSNVPSCGAALPAVKPLRRRSRLVLIQRPSSPFSSPTGGSRGLVYGRLWRRDGVLAVTCAQEGVIRLKPRVSASKL